MSDKNKISLEDRGWSQMASVLESELPQEKRKRRPVFWFFILGALILSAFALSINGNEPVQESETTPLIAQHNEVAPVNTSNDIQNTSLKNIPIENAPIVNLNQVDKSELQPTRNRLSAIIQDQLVPVILEVHESTQIKDQQTKRTISGASEKSSELYTPNRTENKNTIESSSSPMINDVASVVTNDDTKQLDGYLADLESNKNKIQNSISSSIRQKNKYNHLPGIISMVETEQDFLTDLSLVTADQNSSLSLIKTGNVNKNYVFVSGLAGLNRKGTGYQFGLGRKFGDRDFNFYAEVGYARMDYSIGESNARSVNVEINGNEFSITEVLNEDNNASVLKTIENNRLNDVESIAKISSVYISAGVNKSLSGKFNITGGITYYKFLSIENQELNFVSSNAIFQADLDRYNVSRNYLFESGEFKKYEFLTRIGFGYQITPRMTLSANYIHGLTDLINRNDADNISSDLFNNIPAGESQSFFRSPIHRKNAELRIDYSF